MEEQRINGNWNFFLLFNWQMVLFAVLLVIGHHMDWMYQASLFGWWCYADLTARVGHLVWYLDWIPRDPWHVVQSVRNLCWFCGPVVGMMGLGVAYAQGWAWKVSDGLMPRAWYIPLWNNMLRVTWIVWNCALLWVINLAMRGIGFSAWVLIHKWGWIG